MFPAAPVTATRMGFFAMGGCSLFEFVAAL
jgi:hypothetical protein